MEKESGKKFVENFNKAKLEYNKFTLGQLLKLEKWVKEQEVPLYTDRQPVMLINEKERLLHKKYGLKVRAWKDRLR